MTDLSNCSCMEVFGENPECILHGRKSQWAHDHPDICDFMLRAELIEEDLKADRDRASDAAAVLQRKRDDLQGKLDDAVEVLRWMDDHYADQDVSHREFREHAGQKAAAFIFRLDSEAETGAEIERASQSHAPEVPGEIEGETE